MSLLYPYPAHLWCLWNKRTSSYVTWMRAGWNTYNTPEIHTNLTVLKYSASFKPMQWEAIWSCMGIMFQVSKRLFHQTDLLSLYLYCNYIFPIITGLQPPSQLKPSSDDMFTQVVFEGRMKHYAYIPQNKLYWTHWDNSESTCWWLWCKKMNSLQPTLFITYYLYMTNSLHKVGV